MIPGPASGLSIKYAYNHGIKYAYTPELSGGRFDPPTSAIDTSVEEFHAAFLAMIKKWKKLKKIKLISMS